MVLTDITMFAFSGLNSLRMIAYIPQIVSAARDGNGCPAISYSTWAMFMAAHVSAVAYSLVNVQDTHMALVFTVNATCCAAILAVVFFKRRQYARRMPVVEPERSRFLKMVMAGRGFPVRIGAR